MPTPDLNNQPFIFNNSPVATSQSLQRIDAGSGIARLNAPRNFSYPSSIFRAQQPSFPPTPSSEDTQASWDTATASSSPYTYITEATPVTTASGPSPGGAWPEDRRKKRKRSGFFQGGDLKRLFDISITGPKTSPRGEQLAPVGKQDQDPPIEGSPLLVQGHKSFSTPKDVVLTRTTEIRHSSVSTGSTRGSTGHLFASDHTHPSPGIPTPRPITMADGPNSMMGISPNSPTGRSHRYSGNMTTLARSDDASLHGEDNQMDRTLTPAGTDKTRLGKSRWFSQVKDWLSVAEPSAQAMKQQKINVYKHHGVDMNDPQAASKLRMPSGRIPEGAITSTAGPSPEKALMNSIKHKNKRQSYSGWSQTTQSISSAGSHSTSIKEGKSSALWGFK